MAGAARRVRPASPTSRRSASRCGAKAHAVSDGTARRRRQPVFDVGTIKESPGARHTDSDRDRPPMAMRCGSSRSPASAPASRGRRWPAATWRLACRTSSPTKCASSAASPDRNGRSSGRQHRASHGSARAVTSAITHGKGCSCGPRTESNAIRRRWYAHRARFPSRELRQFLEPDAPADEGRHRSLNIRRPCSRHRALRTSRDGGAPVPVGSSQRAASNSKARW